MEPVQAAAMPYLSRVGEFVVIGRHATPTLVRIDDITTLYPCYEDPQIAIGRFGTMLQLNNAKLVWTDVQIAEWVCFLKEASHGN